MKRHEMPASNGTGYEMLAIVNTGATLDGAISRITGPPGRVDGTILEPYDGLGLGTGDGKVTRTFNAGRAAQDEGVRDP